MVAVFSPLSQEFILHDRLQLSKLIILGDGDDNWLILHFVAGKSEVAGQEARRWLLALLGGAKRKEGRRALCFEFLFEGRTWSARDALGF